MKLDITKTLDPEITKFFTFESDLPFFIHTNRFKKFSLHKSDYTELSLEGFLAEQSDPSKRYNSIELETNWLFNSEREVLISVDSNLIEFALVPFVIKEKQTNQEFRIGEKYIVTPDKMVYRLAS